MAPIHRYAILAKAHAARYARSGVVNLSASGAPVFPSDDSSVDSIQAAGIRSFTSPGKQVYVKVLSHFLVVGETVSPGEYVELPENEAKQVERAGLAAIATDEEVAAASKPARAGK